MSLRFFKPYFKLCCTPFIVCQNAIFYFQDCLTEMMHYKQVIEDFFCLVTSCYSLLKSVMLYIYEKLQNVCNM